MRPSHTRDVPEWPTGTVTFLFTDVEGSTQLLDELGAQEYAKALAEHRRVVRTAVDAHGGVEVDTEGDGFFVAFPTAPGALAAAQEAQSALVIPVRMGLHTGTPLLTEVGYIGIDVNRAARIAAAGHGWQVLLSEPTAHLVEGSTLRDLGLHRLKDLSGAQRLYQLGHAEHPPLHTLHQTNLPVQPNPLVGRATELEEARRLLGTTRVLTLVGAAGSGKTRLALHLAAEASDDFEAGVYWASLAAVRDPDVVLPAAAAAMGAEGDLAAHVGERRMALVLDNLEQVIACAPRLAELVGAAPNLKLVVTSREALRIAAEREYEVPPLVEDEAVELFRERALEGEPIDVVRQICRRVDYLPLTIELAAARTKLLSPREILARLDRALPLLTTGTRDAPQRQRTLRATIEWSYELLEPAEREAFEKLAVFAGGWSLDAADTVVDVGLDELDGLVARSLVKRIGDRYSMLETVREFARELFDARDDAATHELAHAAYFLDAVRRVAAGGTALEAASRDTDNVRAAMRWALASGALDVAVDLLDYPDAYRIPLAETVGWTGTLLDGLARLSESDQTRALVNAGGVYYVAGRHEDALVVLTKGLDLVRRLGDSALESEILRMLGANAHALGRPEHAREQLRAALHVAEEAGDAGQYYRALHELGEFEREHGDRARARELLVRAVQLALEDGHQRRASHALHGLGELALAEGNLNEATARYAEALRLALQSSSVRSVTYSLAGLAAVAALEGDVERAGRLWGAVRALEQERFPLLEFERHRYDAAIRTVAGPGFESHAAIGSELDLEATIEYALAP
jgi:predicted ATPase/class 3 adenylate cyclase